MTWSVLVVGMQGMISRALVDYELACTWQKVASVAFFFWQQAHSSQ
jgi:hypothetical protein